VLRSSCASAAFWLPDATGADDDPIVDSLHPGCDFDRRAERGLTRASMPVNGINNPPEMR
jgi:hypothetical protein